MGNSFEAHSLPDGFNTDSFPVGPPCAEELVSPAADLPLFNPFAGRPADRRTSQIIKEGMTDRAQFRPPAIDMNMGPDLLHKRAPMTSPKGGLQ